MFIPCVVYNVQVGIIDRRGEDAGAVEGDFDGPTGSAGGISAGGVGGRRLGS